MTRNKILELLHAYNPSEEEEETKQRFINFINQNPNCFKRELTVGHITGSAWLLNNSQDKALLMHHAKLDIWVQVGGHADGESDILEVALKEAREESGINGIEPVSTQIFDIDIHKIPASSKGEPEHLHYDVRFLLKVTSNEELQKNNESKELKWISKGDKLPTLERSVARMFEKWLNI